MRRNTGRKRRRERIMSMPRWALWFVMQFSFIVMILLLMMMPFIVWGDLGSSEETWTDFSPKGEEKNIYYVLPTDKAEELKKTAEVNLDKEKYRVYFEDKTLVLMVLGGLEYWKMNCGTLSGTGDYFMNLAIKKHAIDIDEMNMDMSFQTGLFAATLYNDCDIFLEQTKSIGLGMMFKKTPQEIILDTIPEISI